ncbi:MAG TPA: hypothetical protein PLP11_00975 [Bacteroidales bacterium]|nr:hypothetical protein [Bacteroidales bacterium]
MKKAILILISFLISYSCFSQVLVPEASTWSHKSHQQNGPVLLDNCHWQANFEEEIPLWSFEHSMGTHDWQVGDTTPDNGFEYDIDGDGVTETAPPLWVYMGRRYVSDYSGSGDRFAYIDGVSDLVTGNPEIFEASICFNSINLSEAIHPKLSFYQNYKAFNGDKTFVDFSTDNGETWTSMEENTEVNVGAYGDNYYQMTAPVFIAGQDNVSLRFRMLTTDATLVGSGYGWQIDDVAFSELPEYDLRLVDFFIHYNDAVFNYPEYTYISSYYGAVLCTSFLSAISFSWIVKNNGYSEVTPSCFVYVYNKNDELLFYDNVQGGVLMSGCVDTIDYLNSFDISEIECFDTLKIILGSNPVAASDYSPLNNADTTMMVISNYFARDNNCINGHIGPSSFDIGHKNGEMLGNAYIISSTVWNPVSLQVFIDSLTSDSTSIRGHVFKFNINSESWDDIVQTTFYPINSTNIGEWVTLYSSEDFGQIEVGYQDMMLLVFGIEFYNTPRNLDHWLS